MFLVHELLEHLDHIGPGRICVIDCWRIVSGREEVSIAGYRADGALDLKKLRVNPREWDAMPDGQLLAIQKGEGEGDITDFNAVLHWSDELRARMSTRRWALSPGRYWTSPIRVASDQDASATVSLSPCITKRRAAPFVRDRWRSYVFEKYVFFVP